MVFTHSYQENASPSWRMIKFALIFALHGAIVVWLVQPSSGPSSIAAPQPIYLRTFVASIPKPTIVKTALPVLVNRHQEQIVLPTPVQLVVNIDPAPALAPPIPVPVQASEEAELPAPVAQPVALTAARFDADYLQNPAPAYPLISRKFREEGKVLLAVNVTAKGIAEHVEIKQSSGYPRLDEAALVTVRKWRFVPARRGDDPVAANVVVPITFRLDN